MKLKLDTKLGLNLIFNNCPLGKYKKNKCKLTKAILDLNNEKRWKYQNNIYKETCLTLNNASALTSFWPALVA